MCCFVMKPRNVMIADGMGLSAGVGCCRRQDDPLMASTGELCFDRFGYIDRNGSHSGYEAWRIVYLKMQACVARFARAGEKKTGVVF